MSSSQRVEFLVTWILRALWMSQGGKRFSGWGALGAQLSTAAWPPGGLGQGGSGHLNSLPAQAPISVVRIFLVVNVRIPSETHISKREFVSTHNCHNLFPLITVKGLDVIRNDKMLVGLCLLPRYWSLSYHRPDFTM